MEECPQLIFNSGYAETNKGINTAQMRSILFKIMLKEVKMFCHQTMEWREGHSQVCLYSGRVFFCIYSTEELFNSYSLFITSLRVGQASSLLAVIKRN